MKHVFTMLETVLDLQLMLSCQCHARARAAGSAAVHEKAPLVRSLMLGGPRGTGKNTLVHAICTETGANLFDLTATNIAGKYPGKDGLKMLMHLVFKVGRALQPSVILVDNCERMFKKKVPKGDAVRVRLCLGLVPLLLIV